MTPRLRCINLVPPGTTITPETARAAKQRGIDVAVHPFEWGDDRALEGAIAAAALAPDDHSFALCICLAESSAVLPAERLRRFVTAFTHPRHATRLGQPLLYVIDREGTRDLTRFVSTIREAARSMGVRQPAFTRIVSAGELDGSTTMPGFDDIVVLPAGCTCDLTPRSGGRAGALDLPSFLIANGGPTLALEMVDAVRESIDRATDGGLPQATVHVHDCNGWNTQRLEALNAGFIEGMEHMPAQQGYGAPFGQTTQSPHDVALSVVMVLDGDTDAAEMSLQSVIDTSSELGEMEIVVLDNRSDRFGGGPLRDLEVGVQVLSNDSRIGIKDAWESAISQTRGQLVLMISSDVMLGHDWHRPLLQALASDPTCNGVSPAIAIGGNYMPTQPPAVNSGVCLLTRGSAARQQKIGDARFVDESVVFLRIGSPDEVQQ